MSIASDYFENRGVDSWPQRRPSRSFEQRQNIANHPLQAACRRRSGLVRIKRFALLRARARTGFAARHIWSGSASP